MNNPSEVGMNAYLHRRLAVGTKLVAIHNDPKRGIKVGDEFELAEVWPPERWQIFPPKFGYEAGIWPGGPNVLVKGSRRVKVKGRKALPTRLLAPGQKYEAPQLGDLVVVDDQGARISGGVSFVEPYEPGFDGFAQAFVHASFTLENRAGEGFSSRSVVIRMRRVDGVWTRV